MSPTSIPPTMDEENHMMKGEGSQSRPPVFVFGSNLAGRHGKGAALWAVQNRGAAYGVGEGRMGDSYALPTKDHHVRTLPLDEIARRSVPNFLSYARSHPELTFQLTPVGCGLAGYTASQIAPLFRDATANILIPAEFAKVLAK